MGARSARVRRVVVGGLVVLVYGGLGACTGGADAGDPPTQAVTTSPGSRSPSPTSSGNVTSTSTAPSTSASTGGSGAGSGASAPVMPAAAKKNTAAGARAAALYFLDVYNYAIQTGDRRDLAAICTAASTFCTNTLRDIDKIASGRASQDGGELSAEILKTHARDALTGGIAIDLRITESRLTWREDGKAPETLGRSVRVGRVELVFAQGSWFVVSLGQLDEE